MGADKGIGKCTFVGSTGKSLVDYAIASQSLFSVINTFMVDDPNIVSDHCIEQFSLLVSKIHIDAEAAQSGNPLKYKYVWDNSQLEAYKIALESDEIKESFLELQSNITEAFSLEKRILNSFQVLIESVCTPLFEKTINQSGNEREIKENSQPKYNDECKQNKICYIIV